MTPPPREDLKDWVLNLVFGKQGTPEERALAMASRPPRVMRIIFGILAVAALCSMLVTYLWSHGWLPFVDSQISDLWWFSAIGFTVLLNFVVDRMCNRYARAAKARLTESA